MRVDPKLAQALRILMTLSGDTNGTWMANHFIASLTDDEIVKVEAISAVLERDVHDSQCDVEARADVE